MKFRAFTLAEVLITLGIIGVVAALTIPTLIANTNAHHFRAMFKKSLSTLNQASRMAQATHDVNFGSVTSNCGENASTENLEDAYTFCSILNGTLAAHTFVGTPENYTIHMTSFDFDFEPSQYIAYKLSDGAMIMFNKYAGGCTSSSEEEFPAQCLGFIDANGTSNPNKLVSCNIPTLNTSNIATCSVSADSQHMTDVYPVAFIDGSVLPASPAARSVLQGNNGGDDVESGGTLNRPGSDMPNFCRISLGGVTPCKSAFRNGFPEAQLKNNLRDLGLQIKNNGSIH